MPYIDQSGLYALEDVLVDLKKEGRNILFVDVLEQPKHMMKRIDIIPDLVSEDEIFNNFNACMIWVKKKYKI